jgi:spore coat protein JC
MWNYERRLEYPVHITHPNAKIAQVIMTQYGGPDGEMGASMRYLSQRYSMSDRRVAGLLTDIGVSVPMLHIGNETCNIKHLSHVRACSRIGV